MSNIVYLIDICCHLVTLDARGEVRPLLCPGVPTEPTGIYVEVRHVLGLRAYQGSDCGMSVRCQGLFLYITTASLSVSFLSSASNIVGLFALPCSFRSPFVDSTCSLYGRPVRAAIQLLLVNQLK